MLQALPILVAVMLAAAGGLFVFVARRNQYRDEIIDRLYANESVESKITTLLNKTSLWKRLLQRMGLEPRPSTAMVILSALVISGITGYVLAGQIGLAGGLLATLTVVYMVGYVAVKRSHAQLLAELPSFLDLIIRSLKTGNSLAGAFREGANETTGRLGPVMHQVVRYMDLGYDVGEALTEIARTHRLRELSIMALAVRVNTHYGGSAVELFQSLIELIHQRERIRRQLLALTSETRFSAIVLGAMPLLIGGYMLAINPDYILTFWEKDLGRWVLLGALFWQALGMLMLWRMVRSIG